ncbi:unnamed protein product, partial [Laminaria digitata]
EGAAPVSALVAPQVAVQATSQADEQVAPQVAEQAGEQPRVAEPQGEVGGGAQEADNNPEQVGQPVAAPVVALPQVPEQVTDHGESKVVVETERGLETAAHPATVVEDNTNTNTNSTTATATATTVPQHPTATFAENKSLPSKGGGLKSSNASSGDGNSSGFGSGNGNADSASGSGTGGSWAGISSST